MDYPRWMTTYWSGAEMLRQDEEEPPPLIIGSGIIMGTPADPNSPRWRVVDVWVSYDRRGHFDQGTHVFLRRVDNTEDDLPKQLAPLYFTDETDDE